MRNKLLGVALLVIVFVASFWGVVSAQSFRAGNTTTVGANETVNSTLWVSGRNIDIAGTVNGDVFCAGQTVTVSGTVRGDLLCTAQTIVISGTVTGDVRSAAQTVTLTGTVLHNATIGAQSFSQSSKSKIEGDASIAANDISLNGSVARDAAVAAAVINLNGDISRDVQATATTLQLGSNAKVAGNLSYTSANNAQLAKSAVVSGTTTKYLPKAKSTHNNAVSVAGFGLRFGLYMFAAALFISLILVLIFPQAIHATAAQGLKSPWKALLVGFVAGFVVPILFFVSMITIIGIPLALLIVGIWLLIEALAGVVSAYFLGRLIWRSQHNPILVMLIGMLVLFVLYFIPVIGIIAFIAAMLLGEGMILLALNSRRPAPKYNLE